MRSPRLGAAPRMALVVSGSVGLVVAGFAATAVAGHDGSEEPRVITARLSGYEEDPAPISTTGTGTLRLRVDPGRQELTYTLRYSGLEGSVTQAHIHFGGRAQSGGVSAFLCTNLGNGPAGTPACPQPGGQVSGTLGADDVVGPAAQGIAAGEMDELIAAIRHDTTYVNVHSTLYPAGEIRSQLDHPGGHG
jgi:CHRD domain